MIAAQNAERLARSLSFVLCLDMLQNMVNPAMWILGSERSVVSTVARLSSYPFGVAYAWLALAALMLPYGAGLITGRNCTLCTRLACLGLCLGGVLWIFFAYLAKGLDYPNISGIFFFNGAIPILMGAVLANSINDAQRAEGPP